MIDDLVRDEPVRRRFRRWLRNCHVLGGAHGHALVSILGEEEGGSPGLTDNVARADRILEATRNAGWIARVEYRPTREQRHFGIGGLPGTADLRDFPVAYSYAFRSDSPGARAFFRDDPGKAPQIVGEAPEGLRAEERPSDPERGS